MQKVKVYVLPVQRQSVQGRSNYTFGTKNGEVNAERTFARGVKKVFPFAGNTDGTALATGLETYIENPYFEQDYNNLSEELRPKSNWRLKLEEIKTQEQITLQTLYEILDNVPEGTYSPLKAGVSMSSSNMAIALKTWTPTFLENFRIYLEDGTNVFTNETQRGRLAIQLVRNHPKIAPDKKSINPNYHEFYIAQQDEALEERAGKRNTVMYAVTELGVLKEKLKAEPFLLYQMAVVLGCVRGNVSTKVVDDELATWVWEQKKIGNLTQEQRISDFEDLLPLFENTEGLDKMYIKYLIKQALNSNIIINEKGKYLWLSQRKIENLFDLGTSKKGVETFFYNELSKAEAEVDSHVSTLETELKKAGVQTR